MIELERVREAKKILEKMTPYVNIGIGKDETGYFISINLEKEENINFPKEINGVSVRIKIIGKIKAFG